MTRFPIAFGFAALCLLSVMACGTSRSAGMPSSPSSHAAASSRAVPAGPAAAPAPTAKPTSCGSGPPRRAYAEQISAAGQVTWQVRLPTDPTQQGISLPPVVTGGTAVFAEENAVYALRVADGHQLWKRAFPRTGSDLYTSMVYGLWQYRGSVIVLVGQVSSHSELFSLNSATGAVQWRLPLGKQGETGSQTLTGDGGLAMIYGHATLTVVDLATGTIRWGRTAGSSEGPVAVDGVVINAAPGQVMGYSSRTGGLLWTRAGMPEQAALLVSAGRVFVFNDDQAVYPPVPLWPVTALSPATGRTLSQTATSGPVFTQSAGPSGVAVATFDRHLDLIDTTTGHMRWSVRNQASQLPFDTGTDVFYINGPPGSSRPSLVDVRAANGSVRWSVPAPAASNGPVFGFGAYAVVFQDAMNQTGTPGVLTAFGLPTGKQAWTVKVPTLLQVPPVVTGADLLVQPTDASYGCAATGLVAAGRG